MNVLIAVISQDAMNVDRCLVIQLKVSFVHGVIAGVRVVGLIAYVVSCWQHAPMGCGSEQGTETMHG